MKADGSVLVHSDGGSYKPLNWMSPPATLRVASPEDVDLELGVMEQWTVQSAKTDDRLIINIHEKLDESSHDLGVDPGLIKDGVEADLQRLLAEQIETLGTGYSLIRREYFTAIGPVDILARDAEVTWEYRCLPDRDPQAILDRVEQRALSEILSKYRARASEADFRTTKHAVYPGLKMDEDSPAVLLARELTGANQVEAVSYGTEAGHFQSYGIPAVICGPGSIEQAHKADEFVALSELAACESFLRKVIAKAST